MKDDLFDYLVATDELDEFLGYEGKETNEMDDDYERNLIIRLEKGEITEEDLDEPLTEEQREDLEFERELMAIHEQNGMGELNDAIDIDDE